MDFIENYFNEVQKIVELIDKNQINKMIMELKNVKNNGGRLFFLGVGGGAGNASHAVNDFRKIGGIGDRLAEKIKNLLRRLRCI